MKGSGGDDAMNRGRGEQTILTATPGDVNSTATKSLGRHRLWLYNRMRIRQCRYMTTHRVLSPAEYRRMPWKNGGGHTTEIAAHPAGSGFASFAWRVSVADVLQDGPFSPFAGIDRTLVLLAGAGMRLTGDGEPLELRTPFEPVSFSGDASLHCGLFAGPVRDFNLMVRRGIARGNVVVRREGGEGIAPADAYICYAAVGPSECLVAGHPPIPLAESHTLLVTADAGTAVRGLSVNPLAAGSVALVARIRFP
jgi:environmental stress-induced protein Ves